MKMRIDKFLHDQQVGSRSEIHDLIKQRRIQMDGQKVKSFKLSVNPQVNHVTVDGQLISGQQDFYYVLNKPAGVITATKDTHNKTVMDLINESDRRYDLFPVGRLDKDTTGVLLIMNDGKLSHQLVSPKQHAEKIYHAELTANLSEDDLRQLIDGVTLKDGTFVQADGADMISSQPPVVELAIHEGKYHQIKRMIGYLGQKVVRLNRVSFAGINVSGLNPGEYRELTEQELSSIK